jgi:hypothetical protein
LGLTGIQSLFPLFALLVLWTLLVFSPFLRRGLRTGRAVMRSLPVPRRFDRGDLVPEGTNPAVPADAGGAMIVDSQDAH